MSDQHPPGVHVAVPGRDGPACGTDDGGPVVPLEEALRADGPTSTCRDCLLAVGGGRKRSGP